MSMLLAKRSVKNILNCLFYLCVFFSCSAAHSATAVHAIALHGDVKYPADFKHFDYADPNAKKGGTIRLGAIGAFDSLNPFVPKGTSANELGLLYDTLTVASGDEPFTRYGLLAKSMILAEDNSGVTFNLRNNAKFHDGVAIKASDIVFTFNLLMEKGSPHFRVYYSDVASVEALDQHTVRFNFKHNQNPELALIVGDIPALPEHFWKDKDFEKSSFVTPLGSGPYKIKDTAPGRQLIFERVKNYWGKDLAVNTGFYNFDEIIYDYYRDATVAVTALKSGEFDLRHENSSKNWATEYQESKNLIKLEIPDESPSGIQAFVMNLRNPLFQDVRVREALGLAFDFEWTNKNLFYNAYTRSYSYFSNSELAATGLPQGEELTLLEQFKGQIPDSVFTKEYHPPVTDGMGKPRANLRKAKQLLETAGWKVRNGILQNSKQQEFYFKILLVSPAFERIVNPYVKNLARLGIKVQVEVADVPRYINHLRQFKFDMIVSTIPQSLSPGNEQTNYWSSQAADTPSSRNYAGIKNSVIDQLVNLIVTAKTRHELVIRTRALDRVLLHNHYVIPQWFNRSHRIAMKDIFARPAVPVKYDSGFSISLHTWWLK